MEGLEVVGAMLKLEGVIGGQAVEADTGNEGESPCSHPNRFLSVSPPSTHKDALISFPSVSLSQILV